MVVKVYVSGISGNKEVKKRQQRVLMILESKGVPCEVVDITEPGKESDKEFMQKNSKLRDEDGRHPLPPQLFNDEEYCGDYDDFDLSNEIDELEKFLKVPVNPARAEKLASLAMAAASVGNGTANGVASSREASADRVVESATNEPADADASSKTGEAQDSATNEAPAEEAEDEEEEEEQE